MENGANAPFSMIFSNSVKRRYLLWSEGLNTSLISYD